VHFGNAWAGDTFDADEAAGLVEWPYQDGRSLRVGQEGDAGMSGATPATSLARHSSRMLPAIPETYLKRAS